MDALLQRAYARSVYSGLEVMIQMPNFQKGCSDVRKLAIWLAAALWLVGGLFNSAQAGPQDDTLYWSSAAKFENLNPYYDLRQRASPLNISFGMHYSTANQTSLFLSHCLRRN